MPKNLIWKIVLPVMVIYPSLYFLVSYYIVWKSESIRLFYTGSNEIESFGKMLIENIRNVLYEFQIFRGLLWDGIGFLLYRMLKDPF